MTELKARALEADLKANRIRNLQSALLKTLAAVFALGVFTASVFSALAAAEAHQNGKIAVKLAASGRATTQQNNDILREIQSVTSQHSSTITTTLELQKDLDHKFIVFRQVIAASCQAERQQSAPKPAISACERLLAKVTKTVKSPPPAPSAR